jgi:hypothetical protein
VHRTAASDFVFDAAPRRKIMCNIKIVVYVAVTPCSLEGGYHTQTT